MGLPDYKDDKIIQTLACACTPFSKTDILEKVELSADEWAFYDNIRQKALAEMENKETTAVQALVQLTRLRQAACNVRLVQDSLPIPSSKLERFVQLVAALHANHHRALVFSQFTSHLALVRERLDAEGVAYLYLDGSTSSKERLQLVEAFQRGDMPLFLISLKAGGLGLNLTAADYVVHLDPWWNPAIEDQASTAPTAWASTGPSPCTASSLQEPSRKRLSGSTALRRTWPMHSWRAATSVPA